MNESEIVMFLIATIGICVLVLGAFALLLIERHRSTPDE